ncbi:MAG TPA: sugar phosphate isomerase/epimerase family protein [Gaiellaceae bacterium]|nr:sugar phosphate isomerase/epimerase family protein [Gaiellaceae bacterium]
MARPRFSVSEFSTLNRSYDEDLAAFAAGGAEGIGLAEVKLPAGDDAESLRKLRESGLKATICIPATLAILPVGLSPEPAEPEARVEALAASIRRLAPFEPEAVLVLTGVPGERDEAEARRIVVESLRELGRAGREAGVPVALEPIHRSAADEFTLVSDLPATEALLAEAGDDAIGILFDTWHLWDTPDVLEHTRRLAARFPAVHVNDWRAETRGWDDRALPGEGVIDLPALLGALEAGGFDGWYDLEILSGEAYPDSLLRLAPEELVRRGREGFLRAWEARAR